MSHYDLHITIVHRAGSRVATMKHWDYNLPTGDLDFATIHSIILAYTYIYIYVYVYKYPINIHEL